MKKKPMFLTNPVKNNHLYDRYKQFQQFVTIERDPATQATVTDFDNDNGDFMKQMVYGGSRSTGKILASVKMIKLSIKPPFKYEYEQGKYLVIVGSCGGKCYTKLYSDRFPQHIVDMLEDPNI